MEAAVIATGARPGESNAKRELFTEETQTVLVFEQGAVIRLSAAVIDGQLLYLTNKATGKEVVTQVLRKRAFRPTSCYVDLQFTEACPGFWGIEFPKSAASVKNNDATKSLSSEDEAQEPATPVNANPPNQQEVDRLKNEVAELQTQPKTLLQPIASDAQAPGLKAPAAKPTADNPSQAKRLEEERLAELFAIESQQEQTRLPKRLVAYPQKTDKPEPPENTGAGKSASKKARTAVAAALLLVAGGVAAYQFGLLNSLLPSAKPAASKSAFAPHSTAAALPGPAQPTLKTTTPTDAGAAPIAPQPSMAAPALSSAKPAVPATEAAKLNPFNLGSVGAESSGSSANPTLWDNPDVVVTDPALAAHTKRVAPTPSSKSHGVSNRFSKAAATPPSVPVETGSAVAPATSEDYVAPKLLKGSKSLAPPEAIQNYVAGNVSMDALVDATGHVKTVTILSGPAKLYATATEAMKRYEYAPARKNGKPVQAHVQVSLQFWYAP